MTGALSNPTYRKLLSAQILSLGGSGLTTTALGILAYELASENAGQVLGFAFAIKMIAYVGLDPIASAIAERLPRKPYLVFLDIMRASLVLLLPFVTQVWQIYVLIFAFQAFSATFTPAFQATIPDILEDEAEYTHALSYSRLTYDLESLVSPVLVGLLLSQLTFYWLFAGTAVGFLSSAVLVSIAAVPALNKVKGQAPFINSVTRGSLIYIGTPRLHGMFFISWRRGCNCDYSREHSCLCQNYPRSG
jgi:MFS family permease